MARRRRYDRIEPWQPPRPPESVQPERRSRSHAKPGSEPADEPVDVDGVAIITVGTVMWAIAFVALLPLRSRLADHGVDWWLWSCAAGVGLGLWGIFYCRRRRDRLAAARNTAPSAGAHS